MNRMIAGLNFLAATHGRPENIEKEIEISAGAKIHCGICARGLAPGDFRSPTYGVCRQCAENAYLHYIEGKAG